MLPTSRPSLPPGSPVQAERRRSTMKDEMKSHGKWVGFLVHFLLGGLAGLVLGFGWWGLFQPESKVTGLILVGVLAILCGVVAGVLKDDFWKRHIHWFSP